jgi:lipopolysaccharide/colanic/teichoic acid biosynthesis glycosyltransferase
VSARPYTARGKRLFDTVAAALLIVLLLPVFGLLAIVVRVCLGRPILFRQQRPGLNGRLFEVLKFRTMTEQNGPDGRPLPDLERRNPLGDVLRAMSLDELPQLFNVLRGEMSLVGPRPLLPEYLPLYSPRDNRRHDVRPGITGLAQTRGRNATTWRTRLALDAWYVDHVSWRLDLAILVWTIRSVASGGGGIEDSWKLGKFRGSM